MLMAHEHKSNTRIFQFRTRLERFAYPPSVSFTVRRTPFPELRRFTASQIALSTRSCENRVLLSLDLHRKLLCCSLWNVAAHRSTLVADITLGWFYCRRVTGEFFEQRRKRQSWEPRSCSAGSR